MKYNPERAAAKQTNTLFLRMWQTLYNVVSFSIEVAVSLVFDYCAIKVLLELGLKNIDSEYFAAIKKFIKMPQFVGIVGGKPNFAYYFCGYIEKAIDDADPLHQLIFLDPHIVRDST